MISLAVTAYNEKERGLCEWVQRCVSVALDHPIVDDVAIVNDASDDIDFLRKTFEGVPKVHIHQNKKNLGVFGNKVESVRKSRSPWVVMCDSDNFMGPDYFDCLTSLVPWDTSFFYCPSFGRPQLDYRHMCGCYNMKEFLKLVGRKLFGCLFNTGNQFVHRQRFLDVFGKYRQDRFDLDQPNYFNVQQQDRAGKEWRVIYDAADSAWINSTWLRNGGSLRIVDGLHYVHNCMPGSFERAPYQKRALHPIYLCEMMDIVSQGEPRKYEFLRRDFNEQRARRQLYRVDNQIILCVWGPDHSHIKVIEGLS